MARTSRAPTTLLAHAVLHHRIAIYEDMLATKTIENPLVREPLPAVLANIFPKPLIDDPDETIQLCWPDLSCAPKTSASSSHPRAACQKTLRCDIPHAITMRIKNLVIEFHSENLPPSLKTKTPKAEEFYPVRAGAIPPVSWKISTTPIKEDSGDLNPCPFWMLGSLYHAPAIA